MSISRIATAAAFMAWAVIAPISANAFSIDTSLSLPSDVEHVAGGCGVDGWRGHWGHCHWAPCAPGAHRGPWGHCRYTTYHGRLPNGGWK